MLKHIIDKIQVLQYKTIVLQQAFYKIDVLQQTFYKAALFKILQNGKRYKNSPEQKSSVEIQRKFFEVKSFETKKFSQIERLIENKKKSSETRNHITLKKTRKTQIFSMTKASKSFDDTRQKFKTSVVGNQSPLHVTLFYTE